MKYGETLRQRSIPAWSHHNIDYDDIKHLIKEQTTAGQGKTISIPGRSDEKLQLFENSLFAILADQHNRIDLFVRSKAGEIRRRLDHSRKQLKQNSVRSASVADKRIPVSRLERYGRLENDVLKAGDEIRSLARFTSTQRTAFRKLLKKYKKWTGSSRLEDRLREDVLDDPKSFTKLDLGPLLDDYSSTLQQIRTLYETRIQQAPGRDTAEEGKSTVGSSAIATLQSAVESGSKVDFDTAIATVPLGESGTFASYFVHPENIVELQVLLLQHARYYLSRSRSNSVTTPVSSSPQSGSNFGQLTPEAADYFALEADDAERFAQEQNSLTLNDREHRPGSLPQKARLCARWTTDEEAVVASRSETGHRQLASLRKKHVYALFDRSSSFQCKKAVNFADAEDSVKAVRRELESDGNVEPLYAFASSRSRFVGMNNGPQKAVLATLDTSITNQKVEAGKAIGKKFGFPFAVLLVRQEGAAAGGLLAALDETHLVERIPGFSMEYHAIWETHRGSPKIAAPFWLPVLSRDIRKLPPPAIPRNSSSADATPPSRGSVTGVTDSTTAVETTCSDSVIPEEMDVPPARSFRKKRKRAYPPPPQQPEQRYWSEYDHPEDGSDDAGDAYVIYIDPNEKSTLESLFERLGSLFGRSRPEGEDGLLTEASSAKDDESSSDEAATPAATPRQRSYGTIRRASTTRTTQYVAPAAPTQPRPSVPHMTPICYVASLVILVMAYILAMTGRRKSAYEVDFGVIFAIASSLLFAVIGFASLLRLPHVSYTTWGLGIFVLIVDAVCSGGLLAWMLG
ncbi:hypothetical protein LTR36_004963 [Oleoguttula mirabilis]|uniref:SPX domain-containing protein n=1 Tax=Oleoguttula mirabilis TaxID=1507867 RepID=A0AAV9JX56_9PEZI|nr:hypothetical protein LTR36_004963 [Oleoguttula mirabilis]